MRFSAGALATVAAHAEEGYPHEVCGLLVGRGGGGRVERAVRARNLITERAADRYEIDPRDQIRVQREADAAGEEVVGYYHSHPDHPARPSIFDAERAWAGPVYLIVSCVGGKVTAQGAFVARQDGGPFREEPIERD